MENDQPSVDQSAESGRGRGAAQPYSFTRSDQIVRGRMPALDIIHDRFVRRFRLTLSSALPMVTDMEVVSTELLRFDALSRMLASSGQATTSPMFKGIENKHPELASRLKGRIEKPE